MMFINGFGAISPQNSIDQTFPFALKEYSNTFLTCLEPDYKAYIPPRVSRRMSRVVKMGVTAALVALKQAGLEKPDAIITGTGLGCMKDTETFLAAITDNHEKYLNPAPFIHSTHNTISSQIALLLKCTGYNQTFAHGPFSFESALLDGMMMLNEASAKSVLIGGVDEMTPDLYTITRRFGIWKKRSCSNLELLDSHTKGTLAGEGAAFLLLENTPGEACLAQIVDLVTCNGDRTDTQVLNSIDSFLNSHQMTVGDIDLCFQGKNGDSRFDNLYGVLEEVFSSDKLASYKQLCGEYSTSTAFACWLAACILKSQCLPDFLLVSKHFSRTIRNILIFNRYQGKHLSMILLKTC